MTFLTLLSGAIGIADWLFGIAGAEKTTEINYELARLDIEFIKSQTEKEVGRLEEFGEKQLGTMKAVIGHSAAKVEGTPLMLLQEQAQITAEDILEVEAISEHAIESLELQLPDISKEEVQGMTKFKKVKGKTFLTRYEDYEKIKKFPYF